jgi:hypothetical protein
MLIKIIITIFVAINLISLLINRSKYKKTSLLAWFCLWILVLISVWIQNSLTIFANFLGIGRGADLAFYIAILVLFFFIFRIYTRLEKIDRKITDLTRNDALQNAKQLNDKDHE